MITINDFKIKEFDALTKVLVAAISHDKHIHDTVRYAGVLNILHGPYAGIRNTKFWGAYYSYKYNEFIKCDAKDIIDFALHEKDYYKFMAIKYSKEYYAPVIGDVYYNIYIGLKKFRTILDEFTKLVKNKNALTLKLVRAKTLKYDLRKLCDLDHIKPKEYVNLSLLVLSFILNKYGKYKNGKRVAVIEGDQRKFIAELLKNYFFNMYNVVLTFSKLRTMSRKIVSYINGYARRDVVTVRKYRVGSIDNGKSYTEYSMDEKLFNNLYKLALWDIYRRTVKFVGATKVYKGKLSIREWFEEVSLSKLYVVNMSSKMFYQVAHLAFHHPAIVAYTLYVEYNKDKYNKYHDTMKKLVDVIKEEFRFDKQSGKVYLCSKPTMSTVTYIVDESGQIQCQYELVFRKTSYRQVINKINDIIDTYIPYEFIEQLKFKSKVYNQFYTRLIFDSIAAIKDFVDSLVSNLKFVCDYIDQYRDNILQFGQLIEQSMFVDDYDFEF